jgi:hypothetical protein
VKALIPPAMMREVESRMDPIPAIRQHANAILRELGISADFVSRPEK